MNESSEEWRHGRLFLEMKTLFQNDVEYAMSHHIFALNTHIFLRLLAEKSFEIF